MRRSDEFGQDLVFIFCFEVGARDQLVSAAAACWAEELTLTGDNVPEERILTEGSERDQTTGEKAVGGKRERLVQR